jgi:hypothetical protein
MLKKNSAACMPWFVCSPLEKKLNVVIPLPPTALPHRLFNKKRFYLLVAEVQFFQQGQIQGTVVSVRKI